MKAIVNIGYRSAELEYSIDLCTLSQEEKNLHFKKWELYQKNAKSKIICKHTIYFDDTDEWQSVLLFDGRTIDFHYDYEERENFDSKKDWANYIFQGYNYIDGEPQMYDFNEIQKVTITF